VNTKFIEATQGIKNGWNHGKFMVARFTEDEWGRLSEIDQAHGLTLSLIGRCGWSPRHILVWDMQTGEGAIFLPGGLASADLDKHKVWVCPMFEPFLVWLYGQELSDLDKLPSVIELPDAPASMYGYRREGKT
jgi:hypothetical protein